MPKRKVISLCRLAKKKDIGAIGYKRKKMN